MEKEKKEGLFFKVFSHAMLTAVGVVVTVYVTNLVKDKSEDKLRHDFQAQVMESWKNSQAMIEKIQDKHEQLLDKYNALKESQAGGRSRRGGASVGGTGVRELSNGDPEEESSGEDYVRPASHVRAEATPRLDVSGNWYTPDGLVLWNFSGNSVQVSPLGPMAILGTGKGTFALHGNTLSGTLQVQAFGGEVGRGNVQAVVDPNLGIMTGKLTLQGVENFLTLYRR